MTNSSTVSSFFAFSWQGRDYSVTIGDVTAAEWRAIKQHTGIKAGEFMAELSNAQGMDGDAVMALLWLGQKHAGDPNPQFCDDLPVFEFIMALADGRQKAEQAVGVGDDGAPKASVVTPTPTSPSSDSGSPTV